MQRVKLFGKWCLGVCALWWLLVWVAGSCQANRVLGVDDLIPTADKWLDAWAAAENGR